MSSTPQTGDKDTKYFLSLIVPAYKAESIIEKVLSRYKETLDGIRYPYEIICVVDGNVDNTYKKASMFASRYPHLVKVVGYEKNLGKGYAVRFGMAKSKGNLIAFADTGFEIDPKAIYMLL